MAKAELQEILQVLTEAGFDAQMVPVEIEGKITDHLVVHLTTDDRKRDVFAQLLYLSDLQEMTDQVPEVVEDEEDMDLLQIYAALPFEFKEEAVPDLARLMLSLNRYLPINGFGLDEEQGLVFCRHVLFCPGGEVDVRVLVEVLGSMAFFVEEHAGILEPVAAGTGSLEAALAEVVRRVQGD